MTAARSLAPVRPHSFAADLALIGLAMLVMSLATLLAPDESVVRT